MLTLLALTAAVAVWAVVQLAQRAPTDSSPQGARPTTSGAAHTTTSGPTTRTPTTPGAATQHDGRNDGHHGGATRTRDAPQHAGTPPRRTPRRTVRPHKTGQPARPPSAGAPSWIRAECARRYPDAARRHACVKYLQQVLGP